jgi:hypothetical protein
VLVQAADIHAVYLDAAFADLKEARDEVHNRGLATAGEPFRMSPARAGR